MSPRTLFLSKLIGLDCILIALSMMTRGQATVETVIVLLQNPSMTLILGVIMLAAGLAMVLAHNIWSGGALVVVVTLVGWMALIKSLFFLFLPHEMETRLFLQQLHYQQFFYVLSDFARPRRLPDVWRVQVTVKLVQN
jgi:vacuolar-type H+-ATPase subunit I/STV1